MNKKGVDILAQVHRLKTETKFFKDVKSGIKQFDVRKNDRDFQIGDTLILEEFDPTSGTYKPGWIPKLITYKLDDSRFVKEGFVILGMQDIKF